MFPPRRHLSITNIGFDAVQAVVVTWLLALKRTSFWFIKESFCGRSLSFAPLSRIHRYPAAIVVFLAATSRGGSQDKDDIDFVIGHLIYFSRHPDKYQCEPQLQYMSINLDWSFAMLPLLRPAAHTLSILCEHLRAKTMIKIPKTKVKTEHQLWWRHWQ